MERAIRLAAMDAARTPAVTEKSARVFENQERHGQRAADDHDAHRGHPHQDADGRIGHEGGEKRGDNDGVDLAQKGAHEK